ncbi:hypothetical protein MMC25_005872 [Agyrium rufum]|nr:hypothetical protein [Agyrium rufum]
MAPLTTMTKSLLLTLLSLQSAVVFARPAPTITTGTSTGSSITTQVPSTTVHNTPGTTGSVPTSLETQGEQTSQPFATTTVTSPTASATAVIDTPEEPMPDANPSEPATQVNGDVVDLFQPIATGPPPSQFSSRGDHPVPRLGIQPQNGPLTTNKFYANLFLGDQLSGVWTHPYSLSWAHGGGNALSWGMSVAHIEASQRAYGPVHDDIPGSPVEYFINPIGIQSIIFGAAELGSDTVLTSDTLTTFSVNANLLPTAGSSSSIQFPMVQGMGFVTAKYTNLTPQIQSSVFIGSAVTVTSPRAGIFKYTLSLEDGTTWLMYVTPADGNDPGFTLASNTNFKGPSGWSGVIQIAKNPIGTTGETLYDGSAGVYPSGGGVSGSTSGTVGTYQISWTKSGMTSQPLLMFALPHHLASFDAATTAQMTAISLQTTTKGNGTAVVADSWTLVESNLPTDMGFAPWSPSTRSVDTLSSAAQSAVLAAASGEAQQDIGAQSNLNSMYYAGKALSKFATNAYTIKNLANSPDLAQSVLSELETAYALFVTNQQIYPLVYDSAWGGLVSSASYTLQDGGGADFGNTYYNDHHFHYSYFIYAAAIIGSMDANWLAQNKDWVNSLVRDVANPVTGDEFFPFYRSFDWYHGHSFAKGLFESGDSKDEESSSEDTLFAYGMKMWGQVTGDTSMEARGNLMLSIMARSLQSYFLYESTNTIQPANFIANKVSGIMFENKIDHVTYFGGNYEYIQGIHMIPLNPASTLTRTQQFVMEEWNTYFADGAVDPASNVTGGWKGILYANLAIIDAKTSFQFFSQENFDPSWLDGGASLTWYLAYAAALGGA